MNLILLRGGQAVGLLGIVLLAVAVVARLRGVYTVGDYQTGTLLLAAIAALAVGCFLLLWLLAEHARR